MSRTNSDWHYQRNPGEAAGKLYYSVATRFADMDRLPGMVDRIQVDVLGVNPILPPGKDPGTLLDTGRIRGE